MCPVFAGSIAPKPPELLNSPTARHEMVLAGEESSQPKDTSRSAISENHRRGICGACKADMPWLFFRAQRMSAGNRRNDSVSAISAGGPQTAFRTRVFPIHDFDDIRLP